MKKSLSVIFFLFFVILGFGQVDSKAKTIHVFVALCDNENQGIVPVPAPFGNGQDPMNNLYWGAFMALKVILKEVRIGH